MLRTTIFSLPEIGFIKPAIKPPFHTGLKKFSTSGSWKQRTSVNHYQKTLIVDHPILKDILLSNQPEELKCLRLTNAIQKLDYISASDCYGLFQVLINWVLNPDDSEVWRPAFKNLQILAETQPKIFTKFIRPNLMIDIALNFSNSDAETYEKIAPGQFSE